MQLPFRGVLTSLPMRDDLTRGEEEKAHGGSEMKQIAISCLGCLFLRFSHSVTALIPHIKKQVGRGAASLETVECLWTSLGVWRSGDQVGRPGQVFMHRV